MHIPTSHVCGAGGETSFSANSASFARYAQSRLSLKSNCYRQWISVQFSKCFVGRQAYNTTPPLNTILCLVEKLNTAIESSRTQLKRTVWDEYILQTMYIWVQLPTEYCYIPALTGKPILSFCMDVNYKTYILVYTQSVTLHMLLKLTLWCMTLWCMHVIMDQISICSQKQYFPGYDLLYLWLPLMKAFERDTSINYKLECQRLGKQYPKYCSTFMSATWAF